MYQKMPKEIVIIGSGGVGREILATLKNEVFVDFIVLGFIDDGQQKGKLINGFPVLGGIDWLIQNKTKINIIIAIGNPSVRQKIIDKLQPHSYNYPTIIHPSTEIHDKDYCSIGVGCYIAGKCVITTDVTIGDFCFINTHCSLQHDTFIENNCTLMPGVRITGGAHIGHGTYISGNTLLSESITIPVDSKI